MPPLFLGPELESEYRCQTCFPFNRLLTCGRLTFGFSNALQLHRIVSMLERTARCPAALDFESDGSIVVKVNGFERRLVNGQQTEGLFAARCREEFAILKGDVDLKSLFAFVLAYVGS